MVLNVDPHVQTHAQTIHTNIYKQQYKCTNYIASAMIHGKVHVCVEYHKAVLLFLFAKSDLR